MYDTQLFIAPSRRYKNQIHSSCVTGFVPWIIPFPIPQAPTPAPASLATIILLLACMISAALEYMYV